MTDYSQAQHTGNHSKSQELESLRRQYQLILNAVGEGVYGLDLQGNVTFVNPAAASMIDWEMDELIGQSMHQVLHHSHSNGNHYQRESCPIYAALHDGSTHRITDEVFWRKDGTHFPVEYISTPIRDEQGQVIGAVVTFRDITQRKWAEEVLQQANEDLEIKVRSRAAALYTANQHLRELSTVKSRLVSMVCHEFRNPLNNIALSVSSLDRYDQKLSTAEKQQYLLSVAANVERMTQMIDNILVLGKIEAKRLALSAQPIELVEFCHKLILEMKMSPCKIHQGETAQDETVRSEMAPSETNRTKTSQADPHHNRLEFIGRFKPLIAQTDETLLRSILTNILSNAIRYSPEDSTVQLSLSQRQHWVIFEVKDYGVGILPDDLPHLFEPFHRGKNVSNIPGTGLGLSIVKQFVALLHGDIKLKSEVGQGTTFRVMLPASLESVTTN